MKRKLGIAILSAGAIAIGAAAIAIPAMAHGPGGHGGPGGPGHELFLLARAAGITHEQIHSALISDTNLKTDFTNVGTTHQALINCLLTTPGSCSAQISAYASAKQALAAEEMNVWQGLFKNAPNLKQAQTVHSELEQLETQRHQIFQQIFGSGGDVPPPPEP